MILEARTRPTETIAVLLGASEFPKAADSLSASPSFKTSAEDFRSYLLHSDGFDLPGNHLLDLFDSSLSHSAMDERVGEFLNSFNSDGKAAKPNIRDVIVYYVGHGGFGQGDNYFLAIKDTRLSNLYHSSYAVGALATTLKHYAAHQRRYIIFDCCFSAAAYKEFMAGPLQVACQKLLEALPPQKGTALLCASGPRNPAKAPVDKPHTMFSGALLKVLKQGIASAEDYFSLEDLAEEVQREIRSTYDDESVRPELHFPDMSQGTLARHRIFPNLVRLATMDRTVEALQNTMQSLLTRLEKQDQQLEKLIAGFEATKLGTISAAEDAKAYVEGTSVPATVWGWVPSEVKVYIGTVLATTGPNFVWCLLCIVVSSLSFFVSPGSLLSTLFIVCTIQIVFAIAGLAAVMDKIPKPTALLTPNADWEKWRDLDVVLQAQRANLHLVFGTFAVGRGSVVAGVIISLLGLTYTILNASVRN